MNLSESSDEAIEKALGELKPTSSTPDLRNRLSGAEPKPFTRSTTPGATNPTWLQLLVRFALPVIAIGFIAKWWPADNPIRPIAPIAHVTPAKPDLQYTPIETNRYVLDAEELALIPGPDDRPVQLMRVRTIDYELSRAKDGSELYVTTQQEKIIPVSLKFY